MVDDPLIVQCQAQYNVKCQLARNADGLMVAIPEQGVLWKPEDICTKANIKAKTNRDVRWVWIVPIILDIIILVIAYIWFQDIKNATDPGRGIAMSWLLTFVGVGIFIVVPVIWLIAYLVAYIPKNAINTKRCPDHPGEFPLAPKKTKGEKIGGALAQGVAQAVFHKRGLR